MSEPRFDVHFHGGMMIDYHFCREWDEDRGCYGTNPDHGFSFEEAKAYIIELLENEIKRWRELTLEKWGHAEEDPAHDHG